MEDSDREKTVDELASRLYWRLERVAAEVSNPKWGDLSDGEREIYRNVIHDLSRYRDLWDRLDDLARDN